MFLSALSSGAAETDRGHPLQQAFSYTHVWRCPGCTSLVPQKARIVFVPRGADRQAKFTNRPSLPATVWKAM